MSTGLATKPVRTRTPTVNHVRVLVVDDDIAVCGLIVAALSSQSRVVATAHDGRSAIASTEESVPHIAIVDLSLGGSTSGIDVVRHLKAGLGAPVHVIVLTGHDDETNRSEAFAAGTDDFVVKPFGVAELRRRVDAAVRNHHAFAAVRLAKEAAERRIVYGNEASALVAHDLNNGLAVALGNLSYLKEILELTPDQSTAFQATLGAVRRMAGLVSNFVDVARFEDAAINLIVSRLHVRTLLESVVALNAPSLKAGIAAEIDCDIELEASFDVGLIERVLHNLFGNATRYCTPGGTITVSAHRIDAARIEIAVTNTGKQIAPTLGPTLFGKYIHGVGGKRGMGLYFCRLVAEAHDGRIDCVATPIGPRFALDLPDRA